MCNYSLPSSRVVSEGPPTGVGASVPNVILSWLCSQNIYKSFKQHKYFYIKSGGGGKCSFQSEYNVGFKALPCERFKKPKQMQMIDELKCLKGCSAELIASMKLTPT